jgi:hypothetical protein
MVGAGYVPDCDAMHAGLESLRAAILADPALQWIESLKAVRRKTAIHLHAKDDHPHVCEIVFDRLSDYGMKLFVAIRRKSVIESEARVAFRYGQKLNENSVYDDLIKRLFRNRLHLSDRTRIFISLRGTKDRKVALLRAVERAKANFIAKHGERDFGQIEIETMQPYAHACLQAVDYHLWALQRLYERGEAESYEKVRAAYRLIMDLDDKRTAEYGEWYTERNILTPKRILLAEG